MSERKESSDFLRNHTNGIPRIMDESSKKSFWDFSSSKKFRDLVLGSLSGFCCGMMFCRVGKLMAVSFTGGIFLIRVMEQKGYLKINWDKLTEDYDQSKKKLGDSNQIISSVKAYLMTYQYFAAPFVGGFLLGVILS